jgi:hypothetical protein
MNTAMNGAVALVEQTPQVKAAKFVVNTKLGQALQHKVEQVVQERIPHIESSRTPDSNT